jgi:2-keto-4-pentenoate hydratase
MSAVWEDLRVSRGLAAQMNLRKQTVAAGHKPIGWKVAFANAEAMQRLQTTGALVGFLTERSILPSGTTVSISDWMKPLAEPEIAVHMGKDLAAGADQATARAAIAGVGPAFELVNNEFAAAADTVEKVMSSNIFHRHVIIGPMDKSRAGCVVDGLVAHVLKNGKEIEPASAPKATQDNLVNIVRHVADLVSASGETLRAGEVIITGSLVTPMPVEPGDELTFELRPAGSVSVRFAPK